MRSQTKPEMEYEGDARRRWRTWSWRESARKVALSALLASGRP